MKNIILLINILLLFNHLLKAQETSTLTDERDGKVYKTVKIGTEWWMAEDLAFKAKKGSYTFGKDKGMENDYTFYSVSVSKKVCPDGWHLPKGEEYENLINYSGVAKPSSIIFLKKGKSGFDIVLSNVSCHKGKFTYKKTGDPYAIYSCSDKHSFNITTKVIYVGLKTSKNDLRVRCIKD